MQQHHDTQSTAPQPAGIYSKMYTPLRVPTLYDFRHFSGYAGELPVDREPEHHSIS